MFDTNLMLRTAGSLDTTAQGSSIDYGQGGMVRALVFKVIVPQATGTTPTCDLVIETADDAAHATVLDKFTLPQITVAGVYRIAVKTPHRYIRYNATIAGTTPDFGVVVIGPEMQGDYDEY